MNVNIHVERGVPKSSEAAQKLGRVRELNAIAGFEMIDEAAAFAHRDVTAPTWDDGCGVFGHVLLCVN